MVGLFTLSSSYTQCGSVLTSQVQNHISQATVLLFQIKKLVFFLKYDRFFFFKKICGKGTKYLQSAVLVEEL